MSPRVLLIGGSSHLGKSTLAGVLAQRLGGTARATDKLGRHPGRPWAPPGHELRPVVVEHFGTLTVDELMASVLAYYEGMAPVVGQVIAEHLGETQAPPLVLEGSALLPSTAAPLLGAQMGGVWLLAEPGLIAERIRAGSRAAHADASSRRLIEAFLGRSVAFDAYLRKEVGSLGLPAIEVDAQTSPEALAEHVLELFGV